MWRTRQRWKKLKRWIRFLGQRLWRGWDDSETWNLERTIAKFALPRLIRFKELNNGFPNDMTPEEWDAALDDIIFAMQYLNPGAQYEQTDAVTAARVQRGLIRFGTSFSDLWW